jgi:hypothetical protein
MTAQNLLTARYTDGHFQLLMSIDIRKSSFYRFPTEQTRIFKMRIGTVLSSEGQAIGKNPTDVTREEWQELGRNPDGDPILSIIRAKCLDCCVYQPSEVAKCTATACALWPYRMGRNPFRANKLTDEQRAALGSRLKKAREA